MSKGKTMARGATVGGLKVACCVLASCALLVAGCALPGVPAPPAPAMPADWAALRAPEVASAVEASRAGLGDAGAPWADPVLQALLARAQAANRDLRLSAQRLSLAEDDARLAGLSLAPQLGLDLSASTGRALQGPATALGWSRSDGAALSASWTPDLWGQLRGQADQAGQAAAMAADDVRALRWDLQARVAEQYWTIARLQSGRERLLVDERAAADTLAAQRLKLDEGTLRLADLDVAVADARALALQRQANALALETARRTLAALVDAPPQDFALPQARLPRERVALPGAGAPMQVLDSRPDVHRARLALDQALLGQRIAQVNRYPTLTLSPGIATGGAGWRHLLDDPGLTLGVSLALPFVDWRARGIAQWQAGTRAAMAAVQFRDALWLALADVAQRQEDFALSLATLADAQGQVAEAARALANAEARLAAGVAAPQELRDARRAERAARNREDDAWRAHAVAWVAMRRALGGDVAVQGDDYHPRS